MKNQINSFFGLDALQTTVKREILAGFTTFISMAYILFVNPTVLGASGMDEGAVFTATALASALGCILMGVLAKYPIATAPALGINAFFSYSVCIGMGVPWQTALAGVFVASLIFIVITIFKLRELIIDAIPADLKYAISGGIGLFIAFLGLSEGGIIVSDDSTLVALGSLSVGTTWLTIFGLVITAVLVALNHVGDINSLQMWVVVLTFLLVTFFDTAGTLVGLANQAGFMKDNKMPRVGKALASDSTAMLAGSLLGTSPVGAYVESSAGIAVGGRSGLTAVTTGVFFLFGLFFSPLLSVVTSQVTAPALIVVGVLMAQSLREIKWHEMEIAIPAFLILLGMPLTYSISDGIALGFIFYPITMLAAKRGKEVSPIMYGLFFVFLGFMWILNV